MTITIDGKPCVCESGEVLLDVASRNGIVIPTLCHHEGLPGQGCCRVCVAQVEAGGRSEIVAACVYPVERECEVFTANETVRRLRAMVLSLLHSLAPDSSEVADLCEEYGAQEYDRFIKKHGGKCILCGLCVKACESFGTGAIWTVKRGVLKAVSTPYDEPSLVCVGCAGCAGVCPADAIEVTETENERKIWNKTFKLMHCPKCGGTMGTQMELWRAASKIGSEVPELCEVCRKKAIANVMADTYGC